jgi:hypothetical protein
MMLSSSANILLSLYANHEHIVKIRPESTSQYRGAVDMMKPVGIHKALPVLFV